VISASYINPIHCNTPATHLVSSFRAQKDAKAGKGYAMYQVTFEFSKVPHIKQGSKIYEGSQQCKSTHAWSEIQVEDSYKSER